MRQEIVGLAQESRQLIAAGEKSRARESAERCLNLLLNRDPMIGTFDVRLLPQAEIGVLADHQVLIAVAGDERRLYVPEEILNRFSYILGRFEVVRKVFLSRPVLGISEGRAIWDLGDGSRGGEYPRIAFCSNLEKAYLVADDLFLCEDGYRAFKAAVKARWIPWEERKETVFWRGTTTGHRLYEPERAKAPRDWTWLQRLHLCDVASRSPHRERLDIGVVEYDGIGFVNITEESLIRAIKELGFQKQGCDKLNFLGYRYVIDIDGMGNAWSGLFQAMLMGATILKVSSPFGYRQWYYDKLIPWEHYIPVQADLSDFDERIDWVFSHPEQCAAMGHSIKAVADQMTYETEFRLSGEVAARAVVDPLPAELLGLAGHYGVWRAGFHAGATAAHRSEQSSVDTQSRAGEGWPTGSVTDGKGLHPNRMDRMTPCQRELMEKLYDSDIWKGFQAEDADNQVQGWNGNHPSLSRLVSGSGQRIVIDVGVWKGQSTVTLASAMKKEKIDGCVIAVDTFLGERFHWSAGGELFSRTHGHPDLYRIFLANIWRAGLCGYVVPLPQTPNAAAKILRSLGVMACLIHLDASHEYEEALRDAEVYWELLLPGGYLIGDDYDKGWPGVFRAANEFSAKVGIPLTIEPPKWILRRPL